MYDCLNVRAVIGFPHWRCAVLREFDFLLKTWWWIQTRAPTRGWVGGQCPGAAFFVKRRNRKWPLPLLSGGGGRHFPPCRGPDSNPLPLWRLVSRKHECAGLNLRKKMKAEPCRLIPRKSTENLELLFVEIQFKWIYWPSIALHLQIIRFVQIY